MRRRKPNAATRRTINIGSREEILRYSKELKNGGSFLIEDVNVQRLDSSYIGPLAELLGKCGLRRVVIRDSCKVARSTHQLVRAIKQNLREQKNPAPITLDLRENAINGKVIDEICKLFDRKAILSLEMPRKLSAKHSDELLSALRSSGAEIEILNIEGAYLSDESIRLIKDMLINDKIKVYLNLKDCVDFDGFPHAPAKLDFLKQVHTKFDEPRIEWFDVQNDMDIDIPTHVPQGWYNRAMNYVLNQSSTKAVINKIGFNVPWQKLTASSFPGQNYVESEANMETDEPPTTMPPIGHTFVPTQQMAQQHGEQQISAQPVHYPTNNARGGFANPQHPIVGQNQSIYLVQQQQQAQGAAGSQQMLFAQNQAAAFNVAYQQTAAPTSSAVHSSRRPQKTAQTNVQNQSWLFWGVFSITVLQMLDEKTLSLLSFSGSERRQFCFCRRKITGIVNTTLEKYDCFSRYKTRYDSADKDHLVHSGTTSLP